MDLETYTLDFERQKALLGEQAWAYYETPFWNGAILDMPFRLSPFTFLIKGRFYRAFYHSLSLKKLFGDERLDRVYRLGKSAGRKGVPLGDYQNLLGEEQQVSPLVEGGFLIPAQSDPMLPLAARQRDDRLHRPRIGLLYLLLSNDCNLRCHYCAVESQARKPDGFLYSQMSPAMARRGVDMLIKVMDMNITDPRVIYYGGEPLLNMETLFESLRYIRERQEEGAFNDRSVNCSIVCNGTLLTDEIAIEMKQLGLYVSVSLDGLERHHNAIRVYKGEQGSWKDALRGYHIAKKHLGNCGISCTLGPHNYQDIEEIAEFFATKLECRGMGFNIMKGLAPGHNLEVPVDEITRHIIKAYRIMRTLGLYEDRIMRKTRAFVNEEPWIFDCGGYGGQIALCADGALGPCHIAADDHRFLWGNIEQEGLEEAILKGDMTRQWCNRSPLLMKECFDCIGLSLCGGGCADEAFIKYGDMFALDKSFCLHCKELIRWMFDDLALQLEKEGSLMRRPLKGLLAAGAPAAMQKK
jgi:uncharacterized protein